MSRPLPIFVDTGGLYAGFDEDDVNHDAADAVFDGMEAGEYGPVFTSRYVLSEFATLMLYQIGQPAAVDALTTVRESQTFNILPVGKQTFDTACEEFERYDDQQISFVDHMSAVLAREHEIEHMFAFESDFRTLGFERIPVEQG
ncbi:type II toxin-antitoxin system VapC family toxin [Halomicrococcus sp. NG-SE-24]|uniref:type II toxin-antitoxin system VapC family toxin n=1 Tax=Halomicrococcus sp. NG-SE-24 TaxID=3436928 RepID=UPI003D976B70